jgi:hypothetical protein
MDLELWELCRRRRRRRRRRKEKIENEYNVLL